MKILCLVDIDDYRYVNSYPVDFVNALKKNANVEFVDYGISWLSLDRPKWDIVHIHWPEVLAKGKILTRGVVSSIDKKLREWSHYTRIICTIHNLKGHYNDSEITSSLYASVFNNCHGFIHLGKNSIIQIDEIFSEKFKFRSRSIIPHGNYASLGEPYDKSEARRKLKLDANKKIILVVGKIRHKEELDLMLNSFKATGVKGCQLFFLGTFLTSRSFLKEFKFNLFFKSFIAKCVWRFKLFSTANVVAKIGVVPPAKLIVYLSSADILFIPRRQILNSGNLALGFSFGKVVIGPNLGNVGEILTFHHNPTFGPYSSFAEVGQCICKALSFSEGTLGDKNKKVAFVEWNWEKNAEKHIKFYHEVMNNSQNLIS